MGAMKKSAVTEEFQAGDIVSWTSQAAGVTRSKTGKIVAILRKGEYLTDALTRAGYDVENCILHAGTMSRVQDRYIVDTTPPGHTGKNWIYAPAIGQLHKQLDSRVAASSS
jgi:hypothetical protein